MARSKTNGSKDSATNLGFEAKLWLTADKLRNNMDAAEYKHVLLPPPGIQGTFGQIVGGWFAKVFRNDRQSHLLATLRDSLLPKLFSEELSVTNLEKEVSA